ncbi:hypothetical protein ACFPM0_30650 [Pseudonocardia sulfidoxydans]|uniref:hypothetical protein n=1 Tax=Pseudonocardia sulfidoxydans TaxID=54011 RepID=UPI003619544E
MTAAQQPTPRLPDDPAARRLRGVTRPGSTAPPPAAPRPSSAAPRQRGSPRPGPARHDHRFGVMGDAGVVHEPEMAITARPTAHDRRFWWMSVILVAHAPGTVIMWVELSGADGRGRRPPEPARSSTPGRADTTDAHVPGPAGPAQGSSIRRCSPRRPGVTHPAQPGTARLGPMRSPRRPTAWRTPAHPAHPSPARPARHSAALLTAARADTSRPDDPA